MLALVESNDCAVLRNKEFNKIRHRRNFSLFSETEKGICNTCHSYKDLLRAARYEIKKVIL